MNSFVCGLVASKGYYNVGFYFVRDICRFLFEGCVQQTHDLKGGVSFVQGNRALLLATTYNDSRRLCIP